jgi:hypothetical protein
VPARIIRPDRLGHRARPHRRPSTGGSIETPVDGTPEIL